MPSSQVVVLPIFGTGTGAKVTAGTVTPNYPARAKTDALLTGEWWPALDDPLSLIDIAVGLPNTLLPVGQFGDATFPTLTNTGFSIPAGKNGLIMPYDDTDASTIMMVVKVPPSGYSTVLGNFSDTSGEGTTGLRLFFSGTTVYLEARNYGAVLALNAPSQSVIAAGQYLFLYIREDANEIKANYGGSTNGEKTILTGSATPTPLPRTLSSRKPAIGNAYVKDAAHIINICDVAWVGYVDSKLTTGQISTIYGAVKALLATAGVTVK